MAKKKKKSTKKVKPRAKKVTKKKATPSRRGKGSRKKVSKKKDVRKTSSKKSTKKTKKVRKAKTTRFNKVQKAYSSFLKEKGIKSGKLFMKQASDLYRRTLTSEIGYVTKNIGALYEEYLGPREIDRPFDTSFPFYNFSDVIHTVFYNGVLIRVYFKDDKAEFKHEGYGKEMDNWYRSMGLYAHLRQYYEYADFVLDGTDNKTYANYVVVTGDEVAMTKEEAEKEMEKSGLDTGKPLEKKPEEPKPEETTPTTEPPSPSPEISAKAIEFEKAKADNAQKQADLVQKQIDLINKRIEYMKMLRDIGMTPEQIIEEMRKLGS